LDSEVRQTCQKATSQHLSYLGNNY